MLRPMTVMPDTDLQTALDVMSYNGNAAGYQRAGRGYGFARLPPPMSSHRYKVALEILRVFKISEMEIVRSR
jgi:hypothetical protein